MKKIRVLVVDDSQLVQQILRRILSADPHIEVVGLAEDPYEARDLIKKLNPDVLTLDIEMPRMNGIDFLEKLMRLRPIPVVMVSTLTEHNASVTLEALHLGAFDYVLKPKSGGSAEFATIAHDLIEKVKAATTSRLKVPASHAAEQIGLHGIPKHLLSDSLIAIGASTGGTEAIKMVLQGFSNQCPPIVITQHIPKFFSRAFAERLNTETELTVCEAGPNMMLQPGCAYVAPGNQHLEVQIQDGKFLIQVSDDPPYQHHRPSVDVMFQSIAACLAKEKRSRKVAALLLTGMGKDGAQALKSLRDLGVHTLAQDETSSVVWGMPGQAVKLGAALEVLPLKDMAARVAAYFGK